MAQDEKGPLVLFYTSFFGRRPPFEAGTGRRPVRLTFDRSRMREADVVIFHIPDAWEIGDAIKYPDQVWIAYSMESSAHYPLWRDRSFMRPFDLVMSHERGADIWTPYLPDIQAWNLLRPHACLHAALGRGLRPCPVAYRQSPCASCGRRSEFSSAGSPNGSSPAQ
jgi:alpha-1,3-fucosyltransferase 10